LQRPERSEGAKVLRLPKQKSKSAIDSFVFHRAFLTFLPFIKDPVDKFNVLIGIIQYGLNFDVEDEYNTDQLNEVLLQIAPQIIRDRNKYISKIIKSKGGESVE